MVLGCYGCERLQNKVHPATDSKPNPWTASLPTISSPASESRLAIFDYLFGHRKSPIHQLPNWAASPQLRIFVGTWNMHGRLMACKAPPDTLEPFLKRPPPLEGEEGSSVNTEFHLIVIGTQECERSIEKSILYPSKGIWEGFLMAYLQPRYVMVRSETMTALHLAVFALRELSTLITGKPSLRSGLKFRSHFLETQSASIATGVGNVVGNKGAVGIALQVGSTSLLFINSHLSAHQRAVQERNQDFFRILRELNLRGFTRGSGGPGACTPVSEIDVTTIYDYTVWIGDLNYRVNGTRKMVNNLLSSNMFEVMLANDQLGIEMRRGTVFQGFDEAPISFPPTYKFDSNKQEQKRKRTLSTRTSFVRRISGSISMPPTEEDIESQSGSPLQPSIPPSSPTSQIRIQIPNLMNQLREQSETEDTLDSPTSIESKVDVCPAHLQSSGGSVYDSSRKQRIPSWTDRILVKTRQAPIVITNERTRVQKTSTVHLVPKMQIVCYDACMTMDHSDHKPVFAHLETPFDWTPLLPLPSAVQTGHPRSHKSNHSACCIQ